MCENSGGTYSLSATYFLRGGTAVSKISVIKGDKGGRVKVGLKTVAYFMDGLICMHRLTLGLGIGLPYA